MVKSKAKETKAAGALEVKCYRCPRKPTGTYTHPDGTGVSSACDLHKDKKTPRRILPKTRMEEQVERYKKVIGDPKARPPVKRR